MSTSDFYEEDRPCGRCLFLVDDQEYEGTLKCARFGWPWQICLTAICGGKGFVDVDSKPSPSLVVDDLRLATGSIRGAIASSSADFNGHSLSLYWNDYRRYYVVEYYWGERRVICRSEDFNVALKAAKEEFSRQGRGASLKVSPRDIDVELAKKDEDLIEGKEENKEWYTWKHKQVASALRLHTDHLLIVAIDEDHYKLLQGFVKNEDGSYSYNAEAGRKAQSKVEELRRSSR